MDPLQRIVTFPCHPTHKAVMSILCKLVLWRPQAKGCFWWAWGRPRRGSLPSGLSTHGGSSRLLPWGCNKHLLCNEHGVRGAEVGWAAKDPASPKLDTPVVQLTSTCPLVLDWDSLFPEAPPKFPVWVKGFLGCIKAPSPILQ